MSHWHRNGSFMFCIDTPSGWSVDDPKPEEAGVEPDFILALTNLKPVSQTFADKGTRVELCDAVVPSFLHKDLGLR
ncbi:MAG: uncharacterized protein KVP18_002225 [Porospora cf. gigantea A]|nr:MAG: hypothetical protein KVP18_002225 [Porospora cf. gigantea A]